jgi:hypothetical protein
MQPVRADGVHQLGGTVHVPDGEVTLFAGFERADFFPRPRAAAAWRVTPSRHSSTVMRNSVAAMLSTNRMEVSGDVPGL